ncbi:MAG: GntR family transcriptional regulator [Saprospiraceae bacterium]|nr:GntR family transcriptional regulator [Saprospiraceae bacterium]MBK8451278.1 GntR family transcriptional regulator [Saprospiraceae bacterium]MBK8483240.1 GntR family transcriptional regulator [Saprospiraceae bacterium]MBK9220752.1 GntR family transcriptional regulator [Saprospiraceae bacterium]MBK9729427.1 GntR family transcriptional regulator [Saprospiraceae bacterium]
MSVQENIINKDWQEGERIPSVRDFATSIQVNPNTVMRTYTLLQDQGILENRRGIGFFVANGAFTKSIQHRKDQFAEEILPELFKNMDQLTISWEEMKQYYTNWKNSYQNETK